MNVKKVDIEKFENLVEPEMSKKSLIQLLNNCVISAPNEPLKEFKSGESDKIIVITRNSDMDAEIYIESNKEEFVHRLNDNNSTAVLKEVALETILFLMDSDHKKQIIRNEIFSE